MKEINYSRFYCNAYLIFYACLVILFAFLTAYFVYSLTIAKNAPAILLGVFMPPIFLLAAKSGFTDVVCFVRFYGLRIKPLDDALILTMDNRECRIPTGKDVDVIYCMTGWLIIWPYGDAQDMILLRKAFLGKSCRELRQYFEQKMNYVSGQGKKRILKSMKIATYNPLKYLRWPISSRCASVTSVNLSR
jgi:hypothetical protein